MKATKHRVSYVYKLIDPTNNEVRYIGATVDPKRRQSQHKRGEFVGTSMRYWSNDLQEVGLYPYMVVIEKCPISEISNREKYWIDYYLDSGADLLNYDGVKRKYSHNKPGAKFDALSDN